MKNIEVIVVAGAFALALVASPLIEANPLPHTVETSYSSTPVYSLVAPITGAYWSTSPNNYTGSWC